MNSSEITAAVSESLQHHIPLIVEEVTKKLSDKKEKWEDYSVEKLAAMAVSTDFKQRCAAAAHPRTPIELIEKLFREVGTKESKFVRLSATINPNIPINTLLDIKNYSAVLKRLKKEGTFEEILKIFVEYILVNGRKADKQHARRLIIAKMESEDFDREIENYSLGERKTKLIYMIFDLRTPAITLIINVKDNPDYNIRLFCDLMICYRIKKIMLFLTSDERELLSHQCSGFNRFLNLSTSPTGH
jgi:hypothetical protein